MKIALVSLILTGLVPLVFAQTTTLIGPGIRNGDFNDDTDPTDQRTFEETPFWENIGGAQSQIAARTNLTGPTGTRNAQISHSPSHLLGQSTGHVISEGNSFSVSYDWRDAFNWDTAVDRMRISLFVTSDDTITGERTEIASTASPLSTTNTTYESVVSSDFYVADATHVGKTAFILIDTVNEDGNGFARLDDFVLTVGAQAADPLLRSEEGDLLFGEIVTPPGGTGVTRTLKFKNLGIANSLTISSIAFSAETDLVFTIVEAPADGSIIAPGGDFTIEVNANGGANFTDYSGELIVTTDPVGQSTTFPISAQISSGKEIFVTSSTVLVDYDDGIANGIHEVSLRNGGFEEGQSSQSLLETPIWQSAFAPEGDSFAGTLGAAPASGSFHGQASGFNAIVPGDQRVQPAQELSLDEWTIAEGDTLTIEFAAKGGADWDNSNMQVIVEVLDEFGTLIADPANGEGVTNRWAARPANFTGDGSSYETFIITTQEIQRDSPWIGNRPRIRFLTVGSRTSFVDIDNVAITGNTRRQVTDLSELLIVISDVQVDPLSQDVTVRFNDIGASGYAIESSSSLDFETDPIEFELDGSEDRITFPGQISFTFEDFSLTGLRHFWRVSTN